MKKIISFAIIILVIGFLIIRTKKNENIMSTINVDPVSHASMILNWDGKNLYTDPVGVDLYASKPAPDMVLLTDIHGDHFDVDTLKKVTKDNTIIVAPRAVLDIMPEELKPKVRMMSNADITSLLGFSVEAIPMYNLPESDKSFHIKGRGNGYVIEKDSMRVYISGDTSGIPEMKNLKNIDMAFVAMNLPYTMGVEEAADATLAFKPKKVYPYHYRTPDGFSDVARFKELLNAKDPAIEVIQLDWYTKP